MSTEVRWRRGTASEHSTFVGADGEVTIDTTNHALRVHDGVTPGGFSSSGTVKQDGTGAVVRTVQDKTNERVSVKDFGAVGNGIVDDTVNIQKAIDYVVKVKKGGVVFFPAGSYKLSASLVIDDTSIPADTGWGRVVIEGEGSGSTQFTRNTDYGDTIRFNHNTPTAPLVDSGIRGITFYHDVGAAIPAMTTGAAINLIGCVRFAVRDCYVINHYDGFNIIGGSSVYVEHCYAVMYNGVGGINGVNNSGYKVAQGNGNVSTVPLPSKIVFMHCGHGGVPNQAGNYGYWITSGEQVELVACEASGALKNNLRIEQTADNSIILEPCIRGGYFDACGEAAIFIGGPSASGSQYIGNVQIHDTVVKASGFGASPDGIFVDGTSRGGSFPQAVTGLIISGCHITTFNRHGINLAGGVQTIIKGNVIRGNSYTTPNNGSGLAIGAAASKVLIEGNLIGYNHTGLSTSNQQYGITVNAASNDVTIDGNDLRGNNIGALLDNTPAPTTAPRRTFVTNNRGFNGARVAAGPTIPASTVTQYNPFGAPAWVSIFGGTMTDIKFNGGTIGTTQAAFLMGPGDNVTLTYTVPPSWIWWPQ